MRTEAHDPYLGALTGLRFVAAALIVAHHSRTLQIPVPGWALDQGVSFYFVLSGFILAYAYPKLATAEDIRRYYVARFARIWPAHLFALLFAVALLPVPLSGIFVANALLVHGWMPSWPWYFSYNAPSWSVSAEVFFYLVFPALILGWERSWWWKWLLSAVLVAGLIRLGEELHLPEISKQDEPTLHGLLFINPLARILEFVTGMVTYSAFRWLQPLRKELSDSTFTVLELGVMAVAAYGITSNGVLTTFGGYLSPGGISWLSHAGGIVVFPFVVLVFAFGRGLLSQGLASGPLRILGEMSYSIYLLHMTIFVAYFLYVDKSVMAPDYGGLIVCSVLTLALSAAVWKYIESPARRAIRQRFAPEPAAPPSSGSRQTSTSPGAAQPGRPGREARVGPRRHAGAPAKSR